MTTDTRSKHRTAVETTGGPNGEAPPPSWWIALASVGICLATAAAIVLIATLT